MTRIPAIPATRPASSARGPRTTMAGALVWLIVATAACSGNSTSQPKAATVASPTVLAGPGTPVPGTATPGGPAELPSQGNVHVNPGDQHVAYSTDPPASGPHFPTVPQRGIYSTAFVTEYLPHFLEHGGVEVLYNKSASADVVKALTDIVTKELDVNAGQVLLAPRPDMPCQVALTGWQRLQAFGAAGCQPGSVGHDFDPASSADAATVKTFVERTMCAYDPENQCGNGPHGELSFPTPVPGERLVTANLAGQPARPVNSATPVRTGAAPLPAIATPAPISGRQAGLTTTVVTLDLSGVAAGQTDQVTAAAVAVLQRRLTGAGVKQANVMPGANGQITVEALGIAPDAAKPLLGATGHLAFMEPLIDTATGRQATDASGQLKWQPACLHLGCPNVEPPLSGRFLQPNAFVDKDAVGQPQVNFSFDAQGADIIGAVTQRNIGKPIAIFFDGDLLTAPVVQSQIRDQTQISGRNLDAQRVVAQLNAGELPVPAKSVETR